MGSLNADEYSYEKHKATGEGVWGCLEASKTSLSVWTMMMMSREGIHENTLKYKPIYTAYTQKYAKL